MHSNSQACETRTINMHLGRKTLYQDFYLENRLFCGHETFAFDFN